MSCSRYWYDLRSTGGSYKLWGVKTYTRIFDYVWGVGSPNPHVAQGSAVLCASVCTCVFEYRYQM